ncbi:DMT family transporter [Paracoccus suum]|uniref:DMT family transporter n=1 Tax=Paracoccus suum TaxID=2259340 RepID=A0A344PH53_9RHOB|nr:DMT family transporter [Paracoccus suum]AXC48708.1 DMT family transporter [Paracoccus suum]
MAILRPSPVSPTRGITLKIVSVMVFIIMTSLIKETAPLVPAGEQVFFRSLFAIPVIFGWLMLRGEGARVLRTPRPMGHFYRGLVGTAAMGLGFAATGMLPLPEVTAIGYAAPLLTVIFAAMFLGEEVRAFRMTAVALGLVGVMIVLSPRLSVASAGGLTARETLGAMLVLMSAVFAALAQIFVRRLVQEEPASTIVFWFSITSTVLALVTLPYGWVWPDPLTAVQLVAIGLLGGAAQILLTSAYRHADASLVAPFEYASMLFALLIGYFVFGEAPTLVMLTGAAIIIAAGVLIIWRERQLGLARARQRKAMTPHG